ncbi:MAG TPA: hypothetical protein VI408_00875 [Gaiellaceae bacterium]
MNDERQRRLALNEAIARDVNAAVEEVVAQWDDGDDDVHEFICECSRDSCAERIHVPLAVYRDVRSNEHRFMVIDAHVSEEIEDRVGVAGDATVVEKTGPGRDVAEKTA